MKRAVVSVLLILLLALLAAASVSWSPAAALHITDAAGSPAAGAYVRYHYDTSILNFVDSLDRVARGSTIVRAGADGTATIPGRLHLRAPWPITTPPRLFVDHVYASRLHNASGPIPLRHGPRQAPLFRVGEGGRVTLVDASRDPALWERSLHELHACIRETVDGREKMADPDDAGTARHAGELIAHLRAEYTAFLDRHGDTPRARPAPPAWASAEERAVWSTQVDANLAREPRWGAFVQRTWERRVKELDRLEGMLP